MKVKFISAAVATLFLSVPMFASASDCDYGNKATKMNYKPAPSQGDFIKVAAHSKPDIVDTAVSAGSFNTLVTALEAADLVNTLKGNGPFTVFAPTDAAFAKVPADALNALLADKAALRKVLLYHVVSGEVTADQVVKISSATTAQGSNLMIDSSNGVMINNATVVKADIMTSNGVIHVIDTVLMPK